MVGRRKGIEAPPIADRQRPQGCRGTRRHLPAQPMRRPRPRGDRHRHPVHRHLLNREASVEREPGRDARLDDGVLDGEFARHGVEPHGEVVAQPRRRLDGRHGDEDPGTQQQGSQRRQTAGGVPDSCGSFRWRKAGDHFERLLASFHRERKPGSGRRLLDGAHNIAGLDGRLSGDPDDDVAGSDAGLLGDTSRDHLAD